MFNGKKKARRLIVFGLSLIMLMSTGLVVSASKQDAGTFSFDLEPYGVKQDSSVVAKYNYNPTPRVDFTTCENKGDQAIWFRLRDAGTGAEATELCGVYGTGTKYPAYLSGYGTYNSAYFIRIQTSSSSRYGAKVRGNWEP